MTPQFNSRPGLSQLMLSFHRFLEQVAVVVSSGAGRGDLEAGWTESPVH